VHVVCGKGEGVVRPQGGGREEIEREREGGGETKASIAKPSRNVGKQTLLLTPPGSSP
jgi:hypothetical protein